MAAEHNKFAYIDALRGVAILMVVLTHTAQPIKNLNPALRFFAEYCQMGVQLFFIASALTLCLSYSSRFNEKNRVMAFYLRRFFRIAPLYYLAIPLYCALLAVKERYLLGSFVSVDTYSFKNIAANVLFVHDFIPSAQNNIVPGGWSIGVEMAFYLVFPVLFAVFRRFAFDAPLMLLAICASVVLNFTLVQYLGYPMENGGFIYYLFSNQLAVFVLGMLAYKIIRDKNRDDNRLLVLSASASTFVVFLLASLAMWLLDFQFSFLFTPILSGLSFAGLAVFASRWQKFPALLQKIGVLSYPIYILHFSVADYVEPMILRIWNGVAGPAPNVQYLTLFIFNMTVVYVMAALAHKMIEAPAIEFGKRLITRLQAGKPILV
jgi:peptidoglycan/LPS O-acetylase OafA/YrhL